MPSPRCQQSFQGARIEIRPHLDPSSASNHHLQSALAPVSTWPGSSTNDTATSPWHGLVQPCPSVAFSSVDTVRFGQLVFATKITHSSSTGFKLDDQLLDFPPTSLPPLLNFIIFGPCPPVHQNPPFTPRWGSLVGYLRPNRGFRRQPATRRYADRFPAGLLRQAFS